MNLCFSIAALYVTPSVTHGFPICGSALACGDTPAGALIVTGHAVTQSLRANPCPWQDPWFFLGFFLAGLMGTRPSLATGIFESLWDPIGYYDTKSVASQGATGEAWLLKCE